MMIIGDKPAYDRDTHRLVGPIYVRDGAMVTRQWAVEPRDLAAIKADHVRRVDADAESIRLRYITPGVGMAMTYQEKLTQAHAVNALGETAANAMSQVDREAQFPTLSASVGIEAPSLWGCAQLVLGRYAAFAALSMGIERARLMAKVEIKAASTAQGVLDVYTTIAWPA